eukprot:COSAG02_NODE_579_length_20073_cov_2118.572745_2_plen_69_part_00
MTCHRRRARRLDARHWCCCEAEEVGADAADIWRGARECVRTRSLPPGVGLGLNCASAVVATKAIAAAN